MTARRHRAFLLMGIEEHGPFASVEEQLRERAAAGWLATLHCYFEFILGLAVQRVPHDQSGQI